MRSAPTPSREFSRADSRAGGTRWRLLIAVGLATAFVLVSVAYGTVKRDALAYHVRDYGYLLSTTVKVFDTTLSDDVTLQPHGVNFLRFEGNDGHRHLLEGVHFEPVRVLQSAIYRLVPREETLYALHAFVFVAPILYVAAHHRPSTRIASLAIALFMLSWLLLPSSLEAATWDLRPYSLLAPVFVLAVLANQYRRPWWEAGLLFLALLLIREEALIFGVVVLAHAALVTDGEEPRSRRRRLATLGALWLLWVPVTLAYFWWTGYEWDGVGYVRAYFLSAKPKVIAGYALLAASAVTLAAFVRWRPEVARAVSRHPLAVYCLVFLPIAFVLATTANLTSPADLARTIVFSPRWSLAWLCALALVPIALDSVRHPKVHWGLTAALGLVVLGSIAVSAGGSDSPAQRWRSSEGRVDEARLVFDMRERIDPRDDVVLVDEATYQAFWDYDGVRVYENLPWSVAQGEERWWPNSAPYVVALLKEDVDFIVLRRDSEERVLALAAEAGVSSRLFIVDANETFIAYAVDDGGDNARGRSLP